MGSFATPEVIEKELGIDLTSPIILMVQHPTSEEYDKSLEQIRETFNAILGFEYQTVIIFPNNDACNDTIRIWIEANKRPFIKIFRNLPRSRYLGLMNVASVLVGNSSSGLIEAPTFNLPVVNIGERQRGRAHGANVIHVPAKREKIREAIKRALKPEFHQMVRQSPHPYLGDGQVSERIVKVLKEITIDDKLIKKGLTY
jgi:GDP/UDP-N,N'-diacetylbacillosamine 2-epimerase (hydrolysing)